MYDQADDVITQRCFNREFGSKVAINNSFIRVSDCLMTQRRQRPQKNVDVLIKDANQRYRQYNDEPVHVCCKKEKALIIAKDKHVQYCSGGESVHEVRKGVETLGSEECFELLKHHSAQIFGDGTFRYAPKTYKKMYNVHVF